MAWLASTAKADFELGDVGRSRRKRELQLSKKRVFETETPTEVLCEYKNLVIAYLSDFSIL